MHLKSKKHLKRVASLGCMLCGNPDAVAHHLLRVETKGMGRKNGDEWAVNLCHRHHDALHRNGDEIGFFLGKRMGIRKR